MTDPLSPEEIAEKRAVPEDYAAIGLSRGTYFHLLDIATDHARLVRMRDAGEGAAVTRAITPSCGHSYDPRHESACPSCLVELRDESYAAGYQAGRDDAVRLNIKQVSHVVELGPETLRALVAALLTPTVERSANKWPEPRAVESADALLAKLEETKP